MSGQALGIPAFRCSPLKLRVGVNRDAIRHEFLMHYTILGSQKAMIMTLPARGVVWYIWCWGIFLKLYNWLSRFRERNEVASLCSRRRCRARYVYSVSAFNWAIGESIVCTTFGIRGCSCRLRELAVLFAVACPQDATILLGNYMSVI